MDGHRPDGDAGDRADPTRRRLLRLAALGATAGLAGCNRRAFDPTGGDLGGTSTPTTTPEPAPELPYDGGGRRLDRPRSVRLRNGSLSTRFVTLVVEHRDRTVYVDSGSVPPGAVVEHSRLVGTEGTYRVVVETASGRRQEREWRVTGALGGLECVVTDAVEVLQVVRCAPDCPPLSRGGEERGLAFDDPTGREPWSGTTLEVTNRTDATRDLSVSVDGRQGRRLAYDYDVPPGTRVLFPLVSGGGRYDVRLTSEAETATYRWDTGAARRLFAGLTPEGPVVGCLGQRADALASNQSEEPATLFVSVRREGRQLYSGEFALDPGETRAVPDLFDGVGPFDLSLSTADGATASYRYPVCPDVGPVFLVVEPDGTVSASATGP
jgi:hypothetical protein